MGIQGWNLKNVYDLSPNMIDALKVIKRARLKQCSVTCISSWITERKNYQNRLILKEVLIVCPLVLMPLQGNQPVQSTCYADKLSRSNLWRHSCYKASIKTHVLWQLLAPSNFLLNLTKYGAYHQIAKILTFHMVYDLFLKSQGWVIYKNSRTVVICNAICPIARLMSHSTTQGAIYWETNKVF